MTARVLMGIIIVRQCDPYVAPLISDYIPHNKSINNKRSNTSIINNLWRQQWVEETTTKRTEPSHPTYGFQICHYPISINN